MVHIHKRSKNYTEFKPLFKWFYDNEHSYDIYCTIYESNSDNRYVLPKLLKLLYYSNEEIYDLFKKFYGLTDETIKDEEYSEDFLIVIVIIDKDKEYIVNTIFEFVIKRYCNNKDRAFHCIDLKDFGELIEYYNNLTSDEENIQNEIDMCKKVITTWRESLLYRNENKFCC